VEIVWFLSKCLEMWVVFEKLAFKNVVFTKLSNIIKLGCEFLGGICVMWFGHAKEWHGKEGSSTSK
jgi:hypothetical protein